MGIGDLLYTMGAGLFSLLGGAGLVLAFSSWLGKVWANRILEKDKKHYQSELEQLKAEYRQEVEQNLQLLRDQIERGQFVHKLQFETEFNAYKDVWKTLAKARDAALRLRPTWDYRPADGNDKEIKQERLEALAAAFDDFQDSYLNLTPFLAPEVYGPVAELSKIIHRESLSYYHQDPDRFENYWSEGAEHAELITKHTYEIRDAIRRRIGFDIEQEE